MNFEEIAECYRTPYTQECDCCGKENALLTQDWGHHEYDTTVYMQCECGEYMEFILPVN